MIGAAEIHSQGVLEADRELVLRDGTILRADIHRPSGERPVPVLLMRTPYGKAAAQQDVYAHPGWFASRGFLVVVQDVRGTGASEGVFEPFRNEARDGADTVAWCSDLEGSDGSVFVYGYSYAGYTALKAAVERPEGLVGVMPAMTSADPGEGWLLRDEVLKVGFAHSWACQLAERAALRAGDTAAAQRLASARAVGPRIGAVAGTAPDELDEYAPFFRRWVEDGFGAEQHDSDDSAGLSVPMMLVTGWYDEFLPGALDTYAAAIRAASPPPVRLVIGPWCHSPWSRYTGSLDFGDRAEPRIDSMMVEWMGGVARAEVDERVQYFSMGENAWKESAQWPPEHDTHRFVLSSSGFANGLSGDGLLDFGETSTGGPDRLVVDPAQPVRSPRGTDDARSRTQWGPIDHTRMSNRRDVLSYTSPILESDLRICGSSVLRVWVASGGPSVDLHATLCDVHQDGSSYPISRGLSRVRGDGEVQSVNVRLDDTCATLAPGHRLRLLLAGTSAPGYIPLSLGGGHLSGATAPEGEPTLHLVHHDESHPSVLMLGASDVGVTGLDLSANEGSAP